MDIIILDIRVSKLDYRMVTWVYGIPRWTGPSIIMIPWDDQLGSTTTILWLLTKRNILILQWTDNNNGRKGGYFKYLATSNEGDAYVVCNLQLNHGS